MAISRQGRVLWTRPLAGPRVRQRSGVIVRCITRGGCPMRIAETCVVVTGGASGIGCALALRFAELGARGVVVADLNAAAAEAVADRIGGIGVSCDVADPDAIASVVRRAEAEFGPVDIFCSNAGYSDDASPDLT